jgi:hypothetical protein
MKDIYYIVYNKETYEIIDTFKYFNRADDLAKSNLEYAWLNVTHPKNKSLLRDINAFNGTNY